jgi:hypothetical protein
MLLAAATIDDRGRSDDPGPGGARHIDRLAGRLPRRHDILDNQDAIVRTQRETATQCQLPILAFGEERPKAQRTPDLLTDDNPAEGRRQHHVRAEATDTVTELRAERLGLTGMSQNQGALHVSGAVQAGRQTEVTFEEGADAAEAIQDGIGRYSRHLGEYTFCKFANIQPPPFVILKSE